MSTTQPIRSLEELQQLKNFYYQQEPNPRNYTLITLGLNTALRISDLLQLTWGDVYDFETQKFRYHITVTEQKTGKENRIALNQNAQHALLLYRKNFSTVSPQDYLFPGKGHADIPLSRSQAFRIIKHASESLHLDEHISCHSMRKTFGYHAWKCGTPPAVLMEIYNHSSFEITKRYLGIEQDDKDSVFLEINL